MLNLKIARMMRNKTQEQFSKEMEVAKNTVSAWERGAINMSIENLNKASDILNVSTDFILGKETAKEFINLD